MHKYTLVLSYFIVISRLVSVAILQVEISKRSPIRPLGEIYLPIIANIFLITTILRRLFDINGKFSYSIVLSIYICLVLFFFIESLQLLCLGIY